MPSEIVYIAGLHRSGTSLLHFIVGSCERYVVLGEVLGLIAPESERLERAEEVWCTCGARANDCELWGPVVERIKAEGGTLSERYSIVLEELERSYGSGIVPVDSSKNLKGLAALLSDERIRVKTLLCIRDVRAWTVSIMQHGGGHLSSLRAFWRWYRKNRHWLQFLHDNDVDWLPVSYDELSLFPTPSTERIFSFLGTTHDGEVPAPRQAEGHAILVNRMKFDSTKMENVWYDNRWFYHQRNWQLPMLLFPRIRDFNSSIAYGYIDNPFEQG